MKRAGFAALLIGAVLLAVRSLWTQSRRIDLVEPGGWRQVETQDPPDEFRKAGLI